MLRCSVLLLTLAITSPLPAAPLTTSVWMVPWEPASLASISANSAAISELNPVWYSLDADGTIRTNWNGEKLPEMTVVPRLVPTIQNASNGAFDDTLAELLKDPAFRLSHAQAIAELVESKHYDGIDIDYERLPASSCDDLSSFLAQLATLLHQNHRELSVTLVPKIDDAQTWAGPGAQDWQTIGHLADSVKVMAYDFHYATTESGPITPLDWLEKIALYADRHIAARKVSIGLPWYGYDWVGSRGTAIGYQDAQKLAHDNAAVIARDANGEAHFTFGDHVVYFEDAATYARQVDVITRRHPSIAGIAHWRAGREDPAVWSEVRQLHDRGTMH